MSFPKIGTILQDTEGQRYRLLEQLSSGSQGVVYTVEGEENLLVKIRRSRHSGELENLQNHLLNLTRRNLETDSLVLPRAVLEKPYLGYVMDRVKDSVPLSELVYSRHNNPKWYLETGGLRRRLRVGAELARAFLKIHRNGLCYGDLSWSNVLISSDVKSYKIKIIDPDNLTIAGTSLAQILGTPDFIAPELLKNESVYPDHASDRWSLAVMLYYLLVSTHPFKGDLVHNGEPELEEQAWRGELPFIDDAKDRSNSSRYGSPRGKVLTPQLQELFQQVFSTGINDKWSRPEPQEWLKSLETAADRTAICEHCGATSYLVNYRNSKFVCDWGCESSSQRPIELGFFDSNFQLDNLKKNEKKELERQRKIHQFVLDKDQKYVPLRLINKDREAEEYAAQYGFQRTSSGEKRYAIKNLTQEVWNIKYKDGLEETCKNNEYVWLEDKTLIKFPSGVRAKVRNMKGG